MRWFRNYALYFAWVVALAGLLGSLYFGEMMNVEPCHLCWYQRIALFPLALLLGIAAYKDDRNIIPYAMPLVIFGGLFAFYHALAQQFPSLHSSHVCGPNAPCTSPGFSFLGFLTLPLLSGIGFVLIGSFLLLARPSAHRQR
ncbi:MAG: disulfide bond formation protein B [Chlamydiota bacterium]